MKVHTSTAQEQTVDFQEQELGVIVARLVLGWLAKIETFFRNPLIWVKCLPGLEVFLPYLFPLAISLTDWKWVFFLKM